MKLVDNIDDQSSTKFYRVYVCTFGFRNSWKRQKLWVLRIYGIYTGEGKMAEITRQLEETGSETQKGKAWCLEEMVRRNLGFERNNFWRETTMGCGKHQKPGNRDWRTGVLPPLPPAGFLVWVQAFHLTELEFTGYLLRTRALPLFCICRN